MMEELSLNILGLGISFLKEAAEITGGHFKIKSKLSVGTTVTAVFGKSHIDRQPLGDITGTITTLIMLNPAIDFLLFYRVNEKEFSFTTKEVRETLGDGIELSNPEVITFISEYLSENIHNLYGGVEK